APALRVAGEFVDEHERGAVPDLVVVELHASDRRLRHVHASPFIDSSRTVGPQPTTSCDSHYLSIDSSRTVGPQPHGVLRLALPFHRLVSDGGAPAPRRPATRTTFP